jgi:hypothetical protein
MGKSTSSDNFVVQNCILSHPHLWKPEPFMQNGVPQGDPFYSTVLLVTEEAARLINGEAYKIAQAHFKNGEFNDPSFGWPCTPANTKPDYANNPRLANLYMCNTKAGQEWPPQVVDGNKQLVLDRGLVYAGCVVAAGINVYTRPQPARPGEVGQGVGVGLKAIMKQGDGEPLGGDTVDTDTMFSGVQAQAPVAGAAMPGGMPAAAPGQPQNAPQTAGVPSFMQPTQPAQQEAPADTGMPSSPFPGS